MGMYTEFMFRAELKLDTPAKVHTALLQKRPSYPKEL